MSEGMDRRLDQGVFGNVSRRGLLHAGLAAGAVGWADLSADVAHAATGEKTDVINVHPDGTYDTVALKKDRISLSVIQCRVRPPDDANNAEPTIKENLDHMIDLIDTAMSLSPPKDLVFFHEFPLTGFRSEWTKEEALKVAREFPGPETEALGRKAKEYGFYLVFGSYVRDPDWPNHLLSLTAIISPEGELIDKHWKARNIKGVFGGGTIELQTSTIFNVLDEYIERYGADAVLPVTRTDIGNICTTSTQMEPEIVRALAIKGGEIILRTASGGFSKLDMQASAAYNRVYVAVANNAHSPGLRGIFEDTGGGGCAIYGPRGEILAEAPNGLEQEISTSVPMAEFRRTHRQPVFHWELYKPVFDKYVGKYDPGLFSVYQPTSLQDAGRYLADKSKWK